MEIIERIYKIMEEKDMSAYQMCSKLKIRQSTMSTWKVRKNDPPAKMIAQMAEQLGVSVEYIVTGKDPEPKKYTNEVEDELLEVFRQLETRQQFEFIGKIKGYLEASEAKKKSNEESGEQPKAKCS